VGPDSDRARHHVVALLLRSTSHVAFNITPLRSDDPARSRRRRDSVTVRLRRPLVEATCAYASPANLWNPVEDLCVAIQSVLAG
jgi:hypothetical protein